MLRPRIIPALLIHKGGLYKTIGFDKPKYVGDPLNAVRIFNEKEVDELLVVDIDATRLGREPDYALIRNLAAECRMPLTYGGGVNTVDHFQRLIGLGVEKVAVGAAATQDLGLVSAAAEQVGRQSVVVVMDVRRQGASWKVFTHNGGRATGLDAVEFACSAEAAGAGEIIVNSIDNDGQMKGYDLSLVRAVRAATSRPLTVLGGAGTMADVASLVGEFGIIGAAAGSLFVFKGVYRAVLISYPNRANKDALAPAT
jgi:imidazole glycerol-phosphate synthase subunit HisF